MFNIALVEDDLTISEGINYALNKKGYNCFRFYDGDTFLENVLNIKMDLIIMDVMLPNKDGFHVSEEYLNSYNTPILFLTARGSIEDKLKGLGLGAEDYLTKPFDLRELMMRIDIILRRSCKNFNSYNINEKTVINFSSKEVLLDGVSVNLSPKEYELLLYLIENKGIVLTRDRIIERVWGYDFDGADRTVDINITRLRKKLELDSRQPIVTVFGMGYKYED
ncbi:response regulator transcription factor [Clostridium sp. YIM B02505]|uniref:Stage 0 sporulation protein A homolog n=1 Tax=Clostridium yunnanense TaxID=2800325 RepID=A0ABS1EKQ9_9CLOT|nr:response regulator transcription factor [Clostridium yunnanense]MBK1809920.1 response regulator transcription factor [Clostridium yunnanense]